MSVALFVIGGDRGHFQFSVPLALALLSKDNVPESLRIDRVEYITNDGVNKWVEDSFPAEVLESKAVSVITPSLGPFPRAFVDDFLYLSSFGDTAAEGICHADEITSARASQNDDGAAASSNDKKEDETYVPNHFGLTGKTQALIQQRIEQKDVKYVVTESIWTSWAATLAERVGKPYFNFQPTFIYLWAEGVPALKSSTFIQHTAEEKPGTMHILTESLRGNAEAYLPDHSYAVGPLLLAEAPEPIPDTLEAWLTSGGDKPVVYLSLGSHFCGKFISRESVTNLLKGLQLSGCRCLAVMRQAKEDGQEEDDLDRCIAQGEEDGWLRTISWAPQRALLAHPAVNAFVSHCGSNSVAESLQAGKPIVCLPFFHDQYFLADALVEQGAGIRLKKRPVIEVEAVRKAVEKVTGSESASFRDAAKRLQGVIEKEDGMGRVLGIMQKRMEEATN